MLMLDLCCGLKGASAAMRDRGWQVITLDIAPEFEPDIVADIRDWSWQGPRPDLVWASPPCEEFSRESMPWSRTGKTPDLSLVKACKRIINECAPTWWVIENTRGASSWLLPLLGPPAQIIFPYYLWGHFPILPRVRGTRKKESLPSTKAAERARIPYSLSMALAMAIELQTRLPLEVA